MRWRYRDRQLVLWKMGGIIHRFCWLLKSQGISECRLKKYLFMRRRSMKKKDKIWLAGDILIGVILMVTGVWISVDYYSTLIFAMGFGLTCSAVSQFIRHYYHTRPENIEAYREKTHRQEIYLKDERKIQLRNRAGYITWAGTMVL